VANIATVATAAILREDAARGCVTAHGLLRAMTRYYGRSYCVPTWSYDDYSRGCIYLQHGEKCSPTGVVQAWERYSRFLQAIWVRWYDDGGDHDAIFPYTADGYADREWCRYGFDRVRISGVVGLGDNLEKDGWYSEGPGIWGATISGSYLAGNDRCDLLVEYPRLPSPTTPARGHMFASETTFRWADDDIPAALVRHEQAIVAGGVAVEFRWRGRPTRVYQRRGDRWWGWYLDDWDNCVATGWLSEQSQQAARGRTGRCT